MNKELEKALTVIAHCCREFRATEAERNEINRSFKLIIDTLSPTETPDQVKTSEASQ